MRLRPYPFLQAFRLTLEQGDRAVQTVDRCTEVLARSRRQLSHQRDFPKQLQGVAHVLDRTLGVDRAGCPAPPLEGAAPLGPAPPIHDLAAFFFDHLDHPPARLRAAVGPGPTVCKHPRALHGWRAGAVAGLAAGMAPQNTGSLERTSRDT
jgi:hypothetical protein